MTTRFYWSTPQTPAGPGSSTEILNRIRLGGHRPGLAEAARVGEAPSGSIRVDDPGANFDVTGFAGHKSFFVEEDEAPSGSQRLFTGYIGDQALDWADLIEAPVTGRVWDVDVLDINAFLGFRVFRDSSANRPAETDLARLTWMFSDWFPRIRLFDEGLVDWTGAVAMDPSNLVGRYVSEALMEMSKVSGKNHFVDYNEATGRLRLAYFFNDHPTLFDSGKRFTNVGADHDNDVTFIVRRMGLRKSPARVYAGIFLRWQGGDVYRTNLPTSQAFGFRDGVSDDTDVKTESAAVALANRYLADHAEEEVQIEATVRFPASRVTSVRKGQIVQIKNSRLSTAALGLSAYTKCRVIERTIRQNEIESDDVYDVDFLLDPIAPVATGSRMLVAYIATANNGDPVSDYSSRPWTKAFVSGNFASPTQFPGPGSSQGMELWYRTIGTGEGTDVLKIIGGNGVGAWAFEIAGIDPTGAALVTSGIDTVSGLGSPSIAGNVGAGQHVLFGGYSLQKVDYGEQTQITVTSGTVVVNANSRNEQASGPCGSLADSAVPRNLIAYITGTGTLTIATTITCSGAIPDYNHFGRGRAAIKIPLTGAFSIAQSAFAAATGAGSPVVVNLPSPPTP